MDREQWIVKKSKRRYHHFSSRSKSLLISNTYNDISREMIMLKMDDILKQLEDCDYLIQVTKALRSITYNNENEAKIPTREKALSRQESTHDYHQVVCYGLGSFSDDKVSRFQLALLLLLKRQKIVTANDWYIYDPLFNKVEKEILKDYDLQLIENNERGKRNVQKMTLFYMPHCPKQLFNNLLWANWSQLLKNIIIFGNNFITMNENILFDERSSFSYLVNIVENNNVHIIELKNTFRFPDIFNDMAIHRFTINELMTSIYSPEEPKYDFDDEEIF